MDLEYVKRVGVGAAIKGAGVLRSKLGRLTEIEKKGEIDLVTEADKESEKIIIESILARFPDHSVLAEETGYNEGNVDCKWIIDPLDGTTNYAHQLGLFSVSIAFEYKGNIGAGIVLNPVTGELFSAVKGRGATLNGKPIHISNTESMEDSLLVTGFPYNFKEIIKPLLARFENCLKASRGVRRLGSAALDLCYVACGRFDGFWEQNLKPWDTAAGVLIAVEAGATITSFSDSPYSIYKNEILATNGRIHKEMISLLEI